MIAIAVGIAAFVISIARILVTNGSALSTLVWAEDGLFPLCVKAHNVVSCTVDPFAGYFLFLPRIVAWPVSLFPVSTWPAVTNVTAGLLAALAAAAIYLLLRRRGVGLVTSIFVSLLPVLAPIMGFEAINAIGSSYMLLVVVAALALCLPPQGKFPTVLYGVMALVTALTIPSSVALLIPLIVLAWRRMIPRRSGLIVGALLVAGLIVQAVTALTAENQRQVSVSIDSLRAWAEAMPTAVLTTWPGSTELLPSGQLGLGAALPFAGIGIALVIIVAALGIWLAVRGDGIATGCGLLLLVGLGLGALPAIAGYANNRYYVLPLLLWTAALLIGLDRVIHWRTNWVMGAIAVVLVVLWIPSFGASAFRGNAEPQWPAMLANAQAACEKDPTAPATVTFTPNWPFADAIFVGPTSNVVPCRVIR